MNAVWNRALALSLLTVGAVGGMSGAAWATPSPPTPIAIVNPSFEADTTPSGSNGTQDYWYIGSFTGWTSSGGGTYAGWFHPSTVEYPGGGNVNTAAIGIPDGSQVAFVNGGAQLGQILSSTWVSNAIYTLNFDVGRRADYAFPTTYKVELLAGSHVVGTASSPLTPSAGSFASTSLIVGSQLVADPYAGLPLGIALLASGPSNQQVNFDNLSLSVVTDAHVVAEPPGVAALILGLLALAFVRGSNTEKKSKPR